MSLVPVLEIGGTHVTCALVAGDPLRVVGRPKRVRFSGDPDIEAFLAGSRAARLGLATAVPDTGWAVAIPGPFDYERGIGDFTGVAKFAALRGVELGALLRDRLSITVEGFLNDADAFGLGEAIAGAGKGHRRGVYLTLGTGVGSAWVRDGRCVHDGADVPPAGHAYRVEVGGAPLEDLVSRRALMRAWRQRTGRELDVREIAQAALEGDDRAQVVFADAYRSLAQALAPYITAFGADVVVIGGSVAASWGLIEQFLAPSMARHGVGAALLPAANPATAPLLGAAHFVAHRRGR